MDEAISDRHFFLRTISRVWGAWRRFAMEQVALQQRLDAKADAFRDSRRKQGLFVILRRRFIVSNKSIQSNIASIGLRYRLLLRRGWQVIRTRRSSASSSYRMLDPIHSTSHEEIHRILQRRRLCRGALRFIRKIQRRMCPLTSLAILRAHAFPSNCKVISSINKLKSRLVARQRQGLAIVQLSLLKKARCFGNDFTSR